MKLARLLLAGSVGLWAHAASAALVWDAAADFSTTDNPNGVWSYGWSASLTSPLTLYAGGVPGRTTPVAVFHWIDPAIGVDPNVTRNVHDEAAHFTLITWAPGQMSLHPGPDGQVSRVRWTSPVAGLVDIAATFTGIDARPTTTDAHVLFNGESQFAATIDGYQEPRSFRQSLLVEPGDVLDFAVGYGDNLDYTFDTTALDARVTMREGDAIPEPATLALLGSALAVGWLGGWRRPTREGPASLPVRGDGGPLTRFRIIALRFAEPPPNGDGT